MRRMSRPGDGGGRTSKWRRLHARKFAAAGNEGCTHLAELLVEAFFGHFDLISGLGFSEAELHDKLVDAAVERVDE